MRRVAFLLLGLLTRVVESLPVCPIALQTGTTGWFTNLVYCGLTKTPSNGLSFTDTEILACLNTLSGNPVLNTNLQTAITTIPACATCIFQFVRDIYKLKATGTSCAMTWIPVTTVASWNSPLCLGDMYEAITAFNLCSNNGLDIRTGATSTRCAYSDYVKVERDFRPWPAMVQLAINNVAVTQYAAQVASFFPTQLAAMQCKTCYDALYTAMKNALGSGNTVCSDSPYDSGCTSFLVTALTMFGQCTGGLQMRIDSPIWCTDSEKDLVETVYRPYESLVACSVFHNPNTMAQFETCMRGYNGLVDLPATTCAPCFVSFVMAVLAQQSPTCASNPLAGPCIDSLNGYRGALPQFAMCAGYEMSTVQSGCTVAEQAGLPARFKSFLPMARASMSAFDLYSAAQLLVNDLSLSDLRIAITHLSCVNCFRAFLIDVWYLFFNSGTKMISCANLTSDGCKNQILKQILGRFVDCAGFNLNDDSPASCTVEEANNQALAYNIATASIQYVNGTDFAVAFNDIYREAPGNLSYACQGCFKLFGIFVANLNPVQKQSCKGFEEAICYQFLAPALNSFANCSGMSFPDIQAVLQQSSGAHSSSSTFFNTSNIQSSKEFMGVTPRLILLQMILFMLLMINT